MDKLLIGLFLNHISVLTETTQHFCCGLDETRTREINLLYAYMHYPSIMVSDIPSTRKPIIASDISFSVEFL
jgi:hypothetical protein